jgi:hypothetical protein
LKIHPSLLEEKRVFLEWNKVYLKKINLKNRGPRRLPAKMGQIQKKTFKN